MEERKYLICRVFCFVALSFLLPIQLVCGTRVTISKSDIEGKSGQEVFAVLQQRHGEAVRQRAEVIYPKRMTLNVDIPVGAKTITLTDKTDFNGCRIVVTNNAVKDFTLFTIANMSKATLLPLSCQDISNAAYGSVDELRHGLKLLVIRDLNPWTRTAPAEGDRDIFRRDVVLVKDGKAQNSTILPYSDDTSEPKVLCYDVTRKKKSFCNLTFERSPMSTQRTRLLSITEQNNVQVSGISVITPYVPEDTDNPLYGEDRCFRVANSANVFFKDITIRGTYSRAKRFGYGINLENVYNCNFKRLNGEAHWGVFGNFCVNTLTLNDCHINRVELHYYGRDFTCKHCIFSNAIIEEREGQVYCRSNVLNTFGSLFGYVRFLNCQFLQSCPLYFRANYQTYTPYDVEFRNCTFNINLNTPYIITAGVLDEGQNPRQELSRLCWPNITIKDSQLNLPVAFKSIDLYHVLRNSDSPSKVHYLSQLLISNVRVNSNNALPVQLNFSNVGIYLDKALRANLSRCDFSLNTDKLLTDGH